MQRFILFLALSVFFISCGNSTPSINTNAAFPSIQGNAVRGNSLTVRLIPGVPGWSYPALNVVSHDQAAITQLLSHIGTLKLVTYGVFCPMDNGYTLHIAERNAVGKVFSWGDVSITGCRFLMFDQKSYWTDQQFWTILSNIVGRPMPMPLPINTH